MNTPTTSTSAPFRERDARSGGAVRPRAPERANGSHQRATRGRAAGALTSAAPATLSMSHTEFRKVLHRAGYTTTQAQSVLRDLPDPIDFDRNGDALLKRGISLDRLVDAIGGSP